MNEFADTGSLDTFADPNLSSFNDAQGDAPTTEPGTAAPTSRAEKRISQLTARNHELQRQLADVNAKFSTVQSRLDEIAGQITKGGDGSLKDWKDLGTGEVQKLLMEQGTSDPATLARAVTEIARRQAAEEARKLESQYKAERENEKRVQETWRNIYAEFPDMQDQKSALFGLANQMGQALQAQYGADVLEKRPELIELAVARAAAKVYSSAARGLRAEVEKFKAADKERAGNEAELTRRNAQRASLKKLLNNGNVKAAAATVMARLHGLKPPEPQE